MCISSSEMHLLALKRRQSHPLFHFIACSLSLSISHITRLFSESSSFIHSNENLATTMMSCFYKFKKPPNAMIPIRLRLFSNSTPLSRIKFLSLQFSQWNFHTLLASSHSTTKGESVHFYLCLTERRSTRFNTNMLRKTSKLY